MSAPFESNNSAQLTQLYSAATIKQTSPSYIQKLGINFVKN